MTVFFVGPGRSFRMQQQESNNNNNANNQLLTSLLSALNGGGNAAVPTIIIINATGRASTSRSRFRPVRLNPWKYTWYRIVQPSLNSFSIILRPLRCQRHNFQVQLGSRFPTSSRWFSSPPPKKKGKMGKKTKLGSRCQTIERRLHVKWAALTAGQWLWGATKKVPKVHGDGYGPCSRLLRSSTTLHQAESEFFCFVESWILNTFAHLGLRSIYKTRTGKFAMIFHWNEPTW